MDSSGSEDKPLTDAIEQAIVNLNKCLGEIGSKTISIKSVATERSEWLNEGLVIKAFRKNFQEDRLEAKSKTDALVPVTPLADLPCRGKEAVEKLSKARKEIQASIEFELSSMSNSVNLTSNFEKHKEPVMHW